ncbi:MAG TPA: Jag N-terminal domain-containing protein, partial [Campylobacterales bacterium]|nr:Jag N-terminal domain-containing protein [Campylobacterales bacterium]
MLASERLGCSITEIEYEVAQAPSKGFLGIGRKKAVLVAVKKHSVIKVEEKRQEPSENYSQEQAPKQHRQEKKFEKKELVCKAQEQIEEKPLEIKESVGIGLRDVYFDKTEIEDNFFRETRDIKEICEEIEVDINNLFACSCFD